MKLRYFFILIVLGAIWGSSFLFARISVGEFGAIPLSAVRSSIGAAILLPMMLFSSGWQPFISNWKHLIVLGLISTALPFTFITLTTQFSTAGFASILNSFTSIMSALIAWVWLKEYLSMQAILGICLSFIGVVIMVVDTQSISSEYIVLPVLTGLGAAFFYGLTGNYSKKYADGLPPIVSAAGCQIFAALFLIPPAIFLWPENSISTGGWINALILGVLCTALAFILFFHLLEKIGVVRTMIVTYLIPLFGLFWGFLFLDEIITLNITAGALLILAGVALTTGIVTYFRRNKREHV